MLHRVKSAPYIYVHILSANGYQRLSILRSCRWTLQSDNSKLLMQQLPRSFPLSRHTILGLIRMPRAVARCAATVCSFTCHLCPFFCVCENWILAWLLGKSFEQLSPHTVIINSFLGPQYSLVPALPAFATCVCDCVCACVCQNSLEIILHAAQVTKRLFLISLHRIRQSQQQLPLGQETSPLPALSVCLLVSLPVCLHLIKPL